MIYLTPLVGTSGSTEVDTGYDNVMCEETHVIDGQPKQVHFRVGYARREIGAGFGPIVIMNEATTKEVLRVLAERDAKLAGIEEPGLESMKAHYDRQVGVCPEPIQELPDE